MYDDAVFFHKNGVFIIVYKPSVIEFVYPLTLYPGLYTYVPNPE